jgi:hypothetical protein
MMPVDCLLYTAFTIYMTTSSYVTIGYGIKAYCALELGLKFLWVYFEVGLLLFLILVLLYHFE